jgi:class 3 adenylate cyclase
LAFQLISQLAQQYEGQILKSIGDGLLFYFPSAINAVNCAQEIQLTFTQINPLSSQPTLTYRIGIHWGDVLFSYSDVTGTGVNIALRVQAETSPGGVGISQTVYEAVRSYLPLQPIEIGQRQFEGIEEPISLYQLTF